MILAPLFVLSVQEAFEQPRPEVFVVDIEYSEVLLIDAMATNSGGGIATLLPRAELHIIEPDLVIPLKVREGAESTRTKEGEVSDFQFVTDRNYNISKALQPLKEKSSQAYIVAIDSDRHEVRSPTFSLDYSGEQLALDRNLERQGYRPLLWDYVSAVLGVLLCALSALWLLVRRAIQGTDRPPTRMDPRADRPIISPDDDKLHYTPFASRIAKRIISTDKLASFTIGITAPWGSGKSSLLNLLEGELRKVDADILVIRFCPWLYDTVEQLVHMFFAVLGDALKREHRGPSINVTAALKAIESSVTTVSSMGALRPLLDAGWTALNDASLDSAKSEINDSLLRQPARVVVFMDDIDRLDRPSLRATFKLIRLIADFSNITYVLAFDRSVIEEALEESGGRQYLEKFIQASFDIPTGESNTIKDLFYSELKAIVEQSGEPEQFTAAKSRLDRYWAEGLGAHFSTIRKAIVRSNSIHFTLPGVIDEVNIADFAALEAIRLSCPQALPLLRKCKSQLLGYWRADKNPADRAAEYRNWFTQTVGECDGSDLVRSLVPELFPVIRSALTSSGPPRFYSGDDEVIRQERRICTDELFDRYFRLFVRHDELRSVDVRRFVDSLKSVDAARGIIRELSHLESALLLELRRLSPYNLSGPQIAVLAEVLLTRGSFQFARPQTIAELIASIFIERKSELPFDLCARVSEPTILFPLARAICRGKNDLKDPLVLCLIGKALASEVFWESQNLDLVLLHCAQSSEDLVRESVQKRIASDCGFCSLINGHVHHIEDGRSYVNSSLFSILQMSREDVRKRLIEIGSTGAVADVDVDGLREAVDNDFLSSTISTTNP